MNLYILRHAIAAERGLPEYEDDSQRPLTSKGEKKMGKIAEAMRALGLEFDLILSSPYLRAKQTAEIVARKLDLEKALKYSDNLVPSAEPAAVISEIRATGSAPGTRLSLYFNAFSRSSFLATISAVCLARR